MGASHKLKRAIFGCSLIAIITVMLMLGSTMAWFADSKVAVNSFTFGKLDVDIMHKNDAGQIVSATAVAFQKCYGDEGTYAEEEFLFEPGATFRLEDIYVRNVGDVPLKYRLEVDTDGVSYTGEENLYDAMEIYMRIGEDEAAFSGDETQELAPGATSEPIRIFLHMKEGSGNEFQSVSASGAVVKVVCIQGEGIPETEIEEAFEEAENK